MPESSREECYWPEIGSPPVVPCASCLFRCHKGARITRPQSSGPQLPRSGGAFFPTVGHVCFGSLAEVRPNALRCPLPRVKQTSLAATMARTVGPTTSTKQNGPPEVGVRYPPIRGYGTHFVGFAESQNRSFLPFLIPILTPCSGGPLYILPAPCRYHAPLHQRPARCGLGDGRRGAPKPYAPGRRTRA